jgi:hypothetical protein
MAANGELPKSDLAPIAGGELRKDAAAAYNAMNQESRERYGVELRPTGPMSSYRTRSEQEYLYDLYLHHGGNLAAVPGTSNHGWGLAVDFATPQMRSIVDAIGPKYGWKKTEAPTEWWHMNYVGGYSGKDPGPSGGPVKPGWWNKVKRKLKATRKKYTHKHWRRQHSKDKRVKARLHDQLKRLRHWIDWAVDRMKANDGWRR